MQAPTTIAVAGATGRVGRHVVDVLKAGGHDVVAMSRSSGVDVDTGDGLPEVLAGVECVIDVATGSSPDQVAATSSSPPPPGTCMRPAPAPACGAWSRYPSSESTGTPRAMAREGRPRAGDALGPYPGTCTARGAVPRVRRAARGVGQAGRGELRAEDAHTAGRRQGRRPGARRPGHRPRVGACTGIVRGTDPGDRRTARGRPCRYGHTVRGPAR